MVPLENLLAFTLAAVVLIVIPGPSVLFTIGRALALGRIGGLLSVLGNALGLLPVIVAVALGVGGIVAQSVVLFTIVKVAGALYLMYLGVQAIRHRTRTAETATGGIPPRSHWRQLGEGFLVGITNPKTIAFFVAVLPQFVDLEAGMVPLQMIELGLVFFAIALISDAVWALVAAAARDWFARSPRRIATLSATGGGLMIGLGGILLFSGNDRH
ncbi:LysE family translocator [Microbacterium sp. NPDC019599]|uniref:LysE family translocator n=1 Tax=Microbacterium sp. NPDC019599 TaxID=3154690 RepID=UPI0033F47D2B